MISSGTGRFVSTSHQHKRWNNHCLVWTSEVLIPQLAEHAIPLSSSPVRKPTLSARFFTPGVHVGV
jgi:hypothetical protein